MLDVLLEKFIRDDLQVSNRINFTLVMHDFFIGEGSDDVIDSIDGLYVGQERISEAFALTSASHQPRNIEDRDTRGNLGTWLINLAQALKPAIRDENLGL